MEDATVSANELSPADGDDPIGTEWETYRTHVRDWLVEGREGQYVLIKGDEAIGFWTERRDAMIEGYDRYLLGPFLVHQIRSREPQLHGPFIRSCLALVGGTNQTELRSRSEF